MNHPTEKSIDVREVFERMDTLEQPAIPIEFINQVLTCDASDFLLQKLSELNLTDLARLFSVIGFAGLYEREVLKNSGLAPGDINGAVLGELGEGLQILARLGYHW